MPPQHSDEPTVHAQPAGMAAPGGKRSPADGDAGRNRRNMAIDVVRGYCIILMISSHVAADSWTNQVLHFLRFVSGAEGFVFLAGFVVGMVYRRKIETGSRLKAYAALLRRARLLYVTHCLMILALVGPNGLLWRYGDLPRPATIGWGPFLWLTATLQLQPGHMMNILPLYVILLAAAPLGFELMRRRMTLLLLAASGSVFVWTQYQPGAFSIVHESSGGDAFPVAAWQFLFVLGMSGGYHVRWLRSTFVGPRRTAWRWGLGLACAALVIVVNVQTSGFEFYDHLRWDATLWERHPLRAGRVGYFLISIGAIYLTAQAAMRYSFLVRPLRAMALMGRNSLYCFLTHIVLAFPLVALLGVAPRLYEFMPPIAVVIVYHLAKRQVGRPWIPN
ncbi:MAG: OpgC domain-containing protein [Armatimonadetes bacterium]|nr:OpgC domain-containing protein [Armatimonadota bacterium]